MSGRRKICTDGEALTTIEGQRVADIAAEADDLALASILTPGSAQKRVVPLYEETGALIPHKLCAPGTADGTVKVHPALLIAGGVALPYAIAMSAKVAADTDSGLFGANSSGSDRYDLLYASIARAVDVTGSRKVKNMITGDVGSQNLNLQSSPVVTLGIVVGTSSSAGPALPADPGDGSAYNFPLAIVKLVNGFTSGTALAQDKIVQAWTRGWLKQDRMQSLKPLGIYTIAPTEKPAGVQPGVRFGADSRFFGHFRLLSSTSEIGGSGTYLDVSIDWRRRHILLFVDYLGSGLFSAFDTVGSVFSGSTKIVSLFSGPGGSAVALSTYSGSAEIGFNVDSGGALRVNKGAAAVIDATNGDLFAVHIWATEQFLTGM